MISHVWTINGIRKAIVCIKCGLPRWEYENKPCLEEYIKENVVIKRRSK